MPRDLPVASAVDFDCLLQAATGETFSYCNGRFLLAAPGDGECIACADLLDKTVFCSLIDRYARKYPGADRRAVVSMWSLYYFSALTMSAVIYWLTMRRVLPMALADMSLVVDPETGEPRAFVLQTIGQVRPQASAHAALFSMIRNHIEPLIASIASEVGIAKKLLWTNVSTYLGWIIREIGHQVDPELSVEGLVLISDQTWPDGWKNPMFGLITAGRQQCGLAFNRRKVCCLRYALPGVPGCGEICPLPHGRN